MLQRLAERIGLWREKPTEIDHCDECGEEIEPEPDPLTGELETFGPLLDHYAEEHPELWDDDSETGGQTDQ